ncbi:ATP-grasp domain-containing protein [Vibrio cyclitrophicus]|uniref:ATP-grasp domain-containing protein n=1 Tax=Vibrio cyclitrophicus ZF270 TaxID=1136176 RepID=A0AAN0N7N3_9VIBR|nr:ATP-grasp domain-containing protein [Vibrio cyclitrophicus]OEE04244.1 hypothetical protein OC7_10380 [Vibrio cyclitrophicus ZF270]
MKRVAIFPAGTEIGLEIHNSLRFVKDIELFGISSAHDHSNVVFENIISDAPYLGDGQLLDFIKEYVTKNKIDYIFPAHDDAVVFLSENEERLACKVVSSGEEVANICRYKSKTYSVLSDKEFIPRTYSLEDLKSADYPVFIKPDRGQGSNGAQKVLNADELKSIKNIQDYVICEYLEGNEYTVDCLSCAESKVLYSSPRVRARVRNGISVSTTNVQDFNLEFSDIASQISERLNMKGAWFFQVKKNSQGKLILLEVACRIAGSMGLHRNLGMNFALNSLYIRDGVIIKPCVNNFTQTVDRALISRYSNNLEYNNVYIDFDDTITRANKVNSLVMSFIYQCRNKGINLFLITRHDKDIYNTLSNLEISKRLFSEIIHIKDGSNKSSHISEDNSIFIDDSFRERFDVKRRLNIPVFDVDSIELLLDWKY